MDASLFFQYTLFLLGSILLIVLIFLGIKMILTLGKVDKLVEDISEKSRKLDGAFGTIDKVTDAISSVNDKFIGIAFNVISNFAHRIKRKKERDDDDG